MSDAKKSAKRIIDGEYYDQDARTVATAYLAQSQATERLVRAAREVHDWYNRDGSVGGAIDPMEQFDAALAEYERTKK